EFPNGQLKWDRLLPALFSSPVVGVAILDSQLGFEAVNLALAAMNGFPAASHIGRKLNYVLGSSAFKIENCIRQVLEMGEPIANLGLTAKLPGRLETGHWVGSYLPIRDEQQRVTRVAALVVELTDYRKLHASLRQVLKNLRRVSAVLKAQLQCFEIDYSAFSGGMESLPKTLQLLDLAIAQTRSIAQVAPRYYPADVPLRRYVDERVVKSSDQPAPQLRSLSNRELQVFKLLADCKSNKDVAGEMKITVRTAETYRARVMMKLQVRSIGHLVRFAVRNNIIRP
ncbi:MAG TPA: LuxR C-terminal-related transcriptional regulator, partial [Candidatus Acidoferrum sp.]